VTRSAPTSPDLAICCPACRSTKVEMVADLPVLKLYRCRRCGTGFAIVRLAEAGSRSLRGQDDPEHVH
jgi:hypothetical protein